MNLLFVAPPLGPFGSGITGGVEHTILNTSKAMQLRNHSVQILTPKNSIAFGQNLIQIDGIPSRSILTLQENIPPVLPNNALVSNMWNYVLNNAAEFDAIINFAYDLLPFQISRKVECPVLHVLSLSSMLPYIDNAIATTLDSFPGTVAVYNTAQANTYTFASKLTVIANGIDLTMYEFCEQGSPIVAWLGRISPEKGLEDAFAVSQETGLPLKICGLMQDEAYWQSITSRYTKVEYDYLGFLPTELMQMAIRHCQALLVTSKCIESSGNVVLEALSCGVPVIAYHRGGPSEIIINGKTGYLTEPDNTTAMAQFLRKIHLIDRRQCRQLVEHNYSLPITGKIFEEWLNTALNRTSNLFDGLR